VTEQPGGEGPGESAVGTLTAVTGTAENLKVAHGIRTALTPRDDVVIMRLDSRAAFVVTVTVSPGALALSAIPHGHRDLDRLRYGLAPGGRLRLGGDSERFTGSFRYCGGEPAVRTPAAGKFPPFLFPA